MENSWEQIFNTKTNEKLLTTLIHKLSVSQITHDVLGDLATARVQRDGQLIDITQDEAFLHIEYSNGADQNRELIHSRLLRYNRAANPDRKLRLQDIVFVVDGQSTFHSNFETSFEANHIPTYVALNGGKDSSTLFDELSLLNYFSDDKKDIDWIMSTENFKRHVEAKHYTAEVGKALLLRMVNKSASDMYDTLKDETVENIVLLLRKQSLFPDKKSYYIIKMMSLSRKKNDTLRKTMTSLANLAEKLFTEHDRNYMFYREAILARGLIAFTSDTISNKIAVYFNKQFRLNKPIDIGAQIDVITELESQDGFMPQSDLSFNRNIGTPLKDQFACNNIIFNGKRFNPKELVSQFYLILNSNNSGTEIIDENRLTLQGNLGPAVGPQPLRPDRPLPEINIPPPQDHKGGCTTNMMGDKGAKPKVGPNLGIMSGVHPLSDSVYTEILEDNDPTLGAAALSAPPIKPLQELIQNRKNILRLDQEQATAIFTPKLPKELARPPPFNPYYQPTIQPTDIKLETKKDSSEDESTPFYTPTQPTTTNAPIEKAPTEIKRYPVRERKKPDRLSYNNIENSDIIDSSHEESNVRINYQFNSNERRDPNRGRNSGRDYQSNSGNRNGNNNRNSGYYQRSGSGNGYGQAGNNNGYYRRSGSSNSYRQNNDGNRYYQRSNSNGRNYQQGNSGNRQYIQYQGHDRNNYYQQGSNNNRQNSYNRDQSRSNRSGQSSNYNNNYQQGNSGNRQSRRDQHEASKYNSYSSRNGQQRSYSNGQYRSGSRQYSNGRAGQASRPSSGNRYPSNQRNRSGSRHYSSGRTEVVYVSGHGNNSRPYSNNQSRSRNNSNSYGNNYDDSNRRERSRSVYEKRQDSKGRFYFQKIQRSNKGNYNNNTSNNTNNNRKEKKGSDARAPKSPLRCAKCNSSAHLTTNHKHNNIVVTEINMEESNNP